MTKVKIGHIFLSIVLVLGLCLGSVITVGSAWATNTLDTSSQTSDTKELSRDASDALKAREMALKMSEYQNAYRGADAASDAFKANVENISALLDDENQTQRVPWYSEFGTWNFAGVAKSKAGSIIVLWRCEGESNEVDSKPIYAFAHATYENGKFTDVDHVMTQQGGAIITSSGNNNQMNDMVDKIRDITKDMDTTNNISDEDYADIASAREALKAQQNGE